MAKLALFISSLNRGGSEREAVNIAENFLKNGHQVLIVTQYVNEDEYPLPDGAVRILAEREEPYGDSAAERIRGFADRFLRLRRIWKKERPDVVLSFIGKNNVMAIVTAMGTGVPVVAHVQGEAALEYPEGSLRKAAFVTFRHAAGVALQTERSRSFFPPAVQAKCDVLANALSPDFIRPPYTGLKEKTITTVGRLDRNKNQRMLLKAFARIAENYPDYKLQIFGDGEDREILENMRSELGLTDRVNMPGSIRNVAEELEKTSLFVLTSDSEGLPNALIEAMALGVPSISTDTPSGGPAQLIEDGVNGLLIPPGDEDALTRAMRQMLDHPEAAARMGEAARAVTDTYAPETAMQRWREYLLSKVKK
ncbi:MAG: glycosyltransferase family 4 protein [Lachnospiraceae bacterium]|nr:glycosyltransferase family 4 protein [Lachnospiraceae bacterium]